MNPTTVTRGLCIATIVYATAFYLVGGAIKPGYSHVSSFISELNATGTPWASTLSLAGFVPVALLLAAFLVAARPLARVEGLSLAGFWLLWSQPLAFFGVAFAPCDAGCPVEGSSAQDLHNLIGLVTYFGAGLAIFLLSFAPILSARGGGARLGLRIASVSWLLLFFLMLAPELAPWRGLVQRFADVTLAATLVCVAWRVVPDPSPRTVPVLQ